MVDRVHDLVGSWIIVAKATGKPVCELYNARNVARINTEKYQVYTAHEWLAHYNKTIAK